MQQLKQTNLNKNALSSVESRLLGDKFFLSDGAVMLLFSFGIQNECYMS